MDFESSTSILFGEIRVFDRCDEAPMLTNWAALHSGRTEANRLERGTRNPNRRKKMSLTTTDNAVFGPNAITTFAGDDGPHAECGDYAGQEFW